MHEKRLKKGWSEENKEMIIINWGVWYYTFVKSSKRSDPKVESIAWGKNESNLKLLKDKILQVKISCCLILCFFL